MKIHQKLHKELSEDVNGTYAPFYFRYLGYRDNFDKTIPIMRAQGIHSLFSLPEARIYKNDLIVGSTEGLYTDASHLETEYAQTIVSQIGDRQFHTNKDHFAPNYRKVLKVGICGLMDEIAKSLDAHKNDSKKCEYLGAMKLTLDGFLNMIRNYISRAKALKSNPEYDTNRLDFIINNTEPLLVSPPKTFAQALQLVWFCHTAFLYEDRYAMALGRMDQYLYPFYENDVKNGILTQEKAVELLENVFVKIQNDVVNICIGGMNMSGKCEINELSYCILWAVKNCNIPGPNLSARITPDTPDEFLDEALKSIGTGLGYPALMNDEINIAALSRYGYEKEDIYDYSMVGCIENFITGKQPPWTDNRFDSPRYLDYCFNNGKSEFNKSVGLNLCDVEDITSMEEFIRIFEKHLKYGADEYCVKFNSVNNYVNQEYLCEPFLSCFCDDCIAKGTDINCGGSKYPSVHGVGVMGIATVADSLAAIEKVVFVDKEATLTDIKNAINNNFEGYEELHQKLLNAPKYGNDDNFVDKYAVWFVEYMASVFENKKTRDGGGIYIAMATNVANIHAGEIIAATPDGRKQGEPLSDAASPSYGKDTRGATCTFNSVTKPDYTRVACGTVINQKFSPSMFNDENRQKLLWLIKTYMQKGGQEIQINATSREILKDAMDNPHNYANLVVRVSGFSDYYTRLAKEVQLDILNRTQQS